MRGTLTSIWMWRNQDASYLEKFASASCVTYPVEGIGAADRMGSQLLRAHSRRHSQEAQEVDSS
ncbi:hypothetical protein AWC23_09730 [Mycobacterium saskatchewanense]|uniref:Uncharacterized protein n=1 Tax=Mycobacterium saskatchewanense TaxID=220927 RepID=A0AAJ3TVT5_9MYCO|nr:hypothetical protein AWC23_09730 [Mycobacterium saskatchewanense]